MTDRSKPLIALMSANQSILVIQYDGIEGVPTDQCLLRRKATAHGERKVETAGQGWQHRLLSGTINGCP